MYSQEMHRRQTGVVQYRRYIAETVCVVRYSRGQWVHTFTGDATEAVGRVQYRKCSRGSR